MQFSLYGLPQFAISTTEVFLRLHLVVYLTKIVGLSGTQAGAMVSASLIVSSVFDPFIGHYSDLMKEKLGQVKPFIMGSLFSLSLFLILIFIPNWSPGDRILLFLLILGYQISYSSFLIPYLALAKELIKSEEDIVTLYAWRYFFGSIGAMVGVSLPFLGELFPTKNFAPMGFAMVGLIILFAPTALSQIKEKVRKRKIERQSTKLFESLLNLFRNNVFSGYYATFTILSIGLGVNQTLAVYYYQKGLNLTEGETSILLGVYMLIFCASIPIWVKFAQKKGKKLALTLGLVTMCCVTLIYPFIPSRNFVALYSLIIFAGIFTGIVALIDSYLSNIIDFHTYKQNEKKANLIFGVWRISDKLSRALGIYIAGIILDYTVYSSQSYYTIKDAFGYGVFLFLLAAAIIFMLQKYNDQHHKKVIRILRQKNPDLLYKAEELEP